MMKRLTVILTFHSGIRWVFLLCAALLTGCDRPKQQLNIFIWSNYLDPELVADFEKQFDCKVNVDYYDDNESMVAKLAAGGSALYDVVAPSTYVIPALVQRGLLAPLRRENLPHFRNLNPRFIGTEFDPENRHTVPLAWGTAGILIRKRGGQAIEETWRLFFDPAQQPGPFVLVEDPRAWIDAAMHFRGHQPNSTDPNELAEALSVLLEVKRRSQGFATQSASINRLLSGEVVMTIGFSMDAARVTREDPELHYFLPYEGGGRWMDNLAIPSQAPHRDLADQFINYLLDPKVAARFADYSLTGTPNQAALEFIRPADRTNAIIYPAEEVVQRLWYAKDLGEKSRLYDELWTQLKAK